MSDASKFPPNVNLEYFRKQAKKLLRIAARVKRRRLSAFDCSCLAPGALLRKRSVNGSSLAMSSKPWLASRASPTGPHSN